MMKRETKYFATTERISISNIGEDDCLLDLGGHAALLSYDAAYDLALRLTYFIQKVQEEEPEQRRGLLN